MSNHPNLARCKELLSMAEQEKDARFALQLVTDALWMVVQLMEWQQKNEGKQ